MRAEIRITGFGGQGVILSGFVLGKAATVFDGKYATLVQSYGPEARGSACAAQVVVSDEDILYPYIKEQRILVALSQEGYDIYIGKNHPEGIVIVDSDLVEFDEPPTASRFLTMPFTRTAEEMGRRMVANIVMLGYITANLDLVSPDAMRKAVESTVPKGTEQLNLMAFTKGFEYSESGREAAAT